MYRSTKALIHLDSFSNNIRELRKLTTPTCFFCPMIKANAYGHGDIKIAQHLENLNVQTMGLGLIEEAVLLREAGIQAELLVFGVFDKEGAKAIVEHRLTPVISVWSQIYDLEKALQGSLGSPANLPIDVHLKFDTGMHRLGFNLVETDKLIKYFESSKKLNLKGLLTHLSCGEDADQYDGKSFEQLRLFTKIQKIFASFSPITHSLNSAGMLNFSNHFLSKLPHEISNRQGVRPGLALYGLSPIKGFTQFKPVMSLRSRIVHCHHLAAGQSVSYGTTWTASRKSVVAIVPIGYADGYHRSLSNKSEVLLFGKRFPQIGNICMDYITIDVTDVLVDKSLEQLHGAEITLFGNDSSGNILSAEELAKKSNTISWEILTSIGERVPRIYEGN